jgi:hypothetical protein
MSSGAAPDFPESLLPSGGSHDLFYEVLAGEPIA